MAAAKKPVKKAVAKKAVAKKAPKPPKRSKWSLEQDLRFKAKKAGKRVSADGNTYTETRPNRSDVSRRNKI